MDWQPGEHEAEMSGGSSGGDVPAVNTIASKSTHSCDRHDAMS